MEISSEIIDWLLGSDPVIVWQVKADLLDANPKDYFTDKKRISKEGWGKQILDLQDTDGRWGSGLYSPKYISTHYTLLLLRKMGMLPHHQVEAGCSQLIKLGAIGGTGIDHKKETCITGMALSIFSHFQSHEEHFPKILDYLEYNQLEDGGWNCRFPQVKSTCHSSMHTTLLALDGMKELGFHFPKFHFKIDQLTSAGNEFLLSHELFKSHTTKEIINPSFLELSFPPRWKYNILSALDYFQSINYSKDLRMEDAINHLKNNEKNGFWLQGKQMSGKRHFSLNQPRKPSEWNTLRALRVLKWWDE